MSSDESPNVPAERHRRDAVREKAQQVQAQQSRARRMPHHVAGRRRSSRSSLSPPSSSPGPSPRPHRSRCSARRTSTNDGFVVTTMSAWARRPIPAPSIDDATQSLEAADAHRDADADPDCRRRPISPSSTSASTSTTCRTGSQRLPARERAAALQVGQRGRRDSDATTRSRCSPRSRTARSTRCAPRVPPRAWRRTRPTRSSRSTMRCWRSSPRSTRTATPTSSSPTWPSASGVESPKVVRSCIEKQAFATWAKAATERALQGLPDTDDVALTGTPMVLVNGIPTSARSTTPRSSRSSC